MKSAWGTFSPSPKTPDHMDSYWNEWILPVTFRSATVNMTSPLVGTTFDEDLTFFKPKVLRLFFPAKFNLYSCSLLAVSEDRIIRQIKRGNIETPQRAFTLCESSCELRLLVVFVH